MVNIIKLSIFVLVALGCLTDFSFASDLDSALADFNQDVVSPLTSYFVGGFFVLVVLIVGKEVIAQQQSGQMNISKIVSQIGFAFIFMLVLYVLNEFIRPAVMEQAKTSASISTSWK